MREETGFWRSYCDPAIHEGYVFPSSDSSGFGSGSEFISTSAYDAPW